MVLFRDFNKSASDLLSRDFAHEKPWDVEFKHRAKNPAFTITSAVNNESAVDAVSAVKYCAPAGSLEAKVGTNTAIADFQYRTPYAPGLTLGFRYEKAINGGNGTSVAKPDSSEFSAEYLCKNEASLRPHLRFGYDPRSTTWNMSAATGVSPAPSWMVRVGTEASGSTDWRLFKYSFGASLGQATKTHAWTASLKSFPLNGNAVGKLVGSVHARALAPGSPEYGAEVTHCLGSSKAQVGFAGLWYLDQPANCGKSDTVLKLKMTHDAKVAAALTRRFSDSLSGTLGVQVSTSRKGADDMKCGVRINLTA